MDAKDLSFSVQHELYKRLQSGITWNLIGALFTQGSVFIVNVIIANILGREVFGEYGMIQSTLLTLSGIAQVATGITATKYVAEFRSVDKERAGRILGLCSAVSLVTACLAVLLLVVSASWLTTVVLKAPHLTCGLIIAAAFMLFSVVNGYQMGALAGLESYYSLARAGIIQSFFHIGICSLSGWVWGLEGALAGLSLSGMIRWGIFHVILRRESLKHGITINYHGLRNERGIILKFALPAAVSGLTSMPALWLANTFLVQQTDGYSQMGLYSAASSLRILVLFLPTLLNNVGMSLLNNQKGLGNENLYRKIFWINIIITAGSTIIMAVGMIFFGTTLLRVFGNDFTEGYTVLLVLMLSTIPESISIAAYQIIQSNEKMWLSFFAIALPRDLMIVLLSYYMIPLYNAVGLALAYAISWSLALVLIITIALSIGLRISSNQLKSSL